MKKLFSLCMVIVMAFSIAGCSSEGHEGQAKTPSGSSVQHGRDYQEVYEQFEKKGFTNIQFEVLDDLVTGWLTKDGEVESVSVDGDTGYSADKWYPADVEVIITYHTFPNKDGGNDTSDNSQTTEPVTSETTEPTTDEPTTDEPMAEPTDGILTVENCEALAAMLTLNADRDDSYADFAKQYLGKTIEFDGSIDYKDNHISYNPFNGSSSTSKYEYDILVSYGDYDANNRTGPTIKIENVSSRKLGYDVSKTLPSFMAVGCNVRIRVRVVSYNENTGIFEMHLESIEAR